MPLFSSPVATNNQKFIQLLDVRSSGTGGGASTSGSWIDRVINTIAVDETSLVALDSNQFTLPSGTYYIDATANFYRSFEVKLRLFDNTNSTTLLSSLNGYMGFYDAAIDVPLNGKFTVTGSEELSIQYRLNNASSIGLGIASSFGVDEIYLIANLWKIS